MFESPQSLQTVCVDFICDNISAICEEQSNLDDNAVKYVFRDSEIYCHSEVSEQLLEVFSKKLTITDRLLLLFDSQATRLERVRIHNAKHITTKGLRALRSHKITELEVTGLAKVTVNDLIGCLGDWTLQNLELLNVSNSTFINNEKVRVVVALSKLRNLRTLNVSNTEFNLRGLEIVTEDLPLLENLDISSTMIKDISPLKNCKDKLRYLNMYNLKIFSCEDFLPVLCELHQLRHLDISDDKDDPLDMATSLKYKVTDLLRNTTCLPNLVSLDISGKDGIYVDDLKAFLKSHQCLKFLGLMQTEVCFEDMFSRDSDLYDPDLLVTGYATVAQILESLKRYVDRKFYIQKALYHLYSHTQNFSEARTDIIKLVLPGMQQHPKMLGIQMAATACLYNLSKGSLGLKIHPYWLKQIVDLTLKAMENFPKHQQLQKNTLLTLCSDRILQDVTFDRYHCAELVMESLVAFDDPSMNRMSVAICSILAAKISTAQTSSLGAKSPYMERLLNIVRIKTEEQEEVDIMMKFTLSALWNLTDESPRTCTAFLDMGGMELFLKVLQRFAGESAVETKVLGLVNNIAEVAHLRPYLMKDDFLTVLRSLLHSSHVDVSYFAAGIVAHLASDGLDVWNCRLVSREVMLNELGSVVLNWSTPDAEMVAYRSFNPFFPLLSCHEMEVQLWAVWAIHHVCSKNLKYTEWPEMVTCLIPVISLSNLNIDSIVGGESIVALLYRESFIISVTVSYNYDTLSNDFGSPFVIPAICYSHQSPLKKPNALAKRYCPMLVEEDGVRLLKLLLLSPDTSSSVTSICQGILQVVEQGASGYIRDH